MLSKPFRLLFISSIIFFSAFILFPVSNPAVADDSGIKILEKETLGRYLVDWRGITLYRFARDEKNISHCIEGCAANWPPFYTDMVSGVKGCEDSDFSTITRPDGTKQTTYNGMPLYYFKNDRYTGDTFGNGIGDVWFLVKP